jgi:hypothetical protein
MEFLGVDPLTASAGELLGAVEDMAPGPMLWSVLLMVDRLRLTPDEAVLYLRLHERVMAWWSGLQTEALVAAADPQPRMDEYLVLDRAADHGTERVIRIEDAAREEVASALRLSPVTAQRRIDTARLLHGPLVATREALEYGDISIAHVAVIVEAVQRLSSRPPHGEPSTEQFVEDCHAVERRVLPTARRAAPARMRTVANRAVEAVDAEGQRRRRASARRTRDVWCEPDVDGITTLQARLDTMTARALMATVDAAVTDAAVDGDCTATLGERRAEVLARLVMGGGEAGGQGSGTGSLSVAIDAVVTLAELADPSRRGETAEGLVELLADPAVSASVRAVVVDADGGHVLDVGRRRYELPASLRRLIVGRDVTCRFPGCGRAASRCQIDHAEAWEDGGASDVANLGALCTRHHQLKTHGGWRIVDSRADGSCTWISPTGYRYHRPPERLVLCDEGPPPEPERHAREPVPAPF